MNVFQPFSLRYHNRDGGTSAAPVRRVPFVDDGANVLMGDPFRLNNGIILTYAAGSATFGVALYDTPEAEANVRKDTRGNFMLHYPTEENAVFKVQCLNLESDVAVAVAIDILGHTFDMTGNAGEMFLDVSQAGTDWRVIDIESTVSEWGDDYPIVIIKCANSQQALEA